MHYLYAKRENTAFAYPKNKEFLVDVDNNPALLLHWKTWNCKKRVSPTRPDPGVCHVLAPHDIRQYGNIW